jgi:hypothetical protein
LVKGPERHIEWMARPIRRQYENAMFSDFWKWPRGFCERFFADVGVAMGFKSKLHAK